MLFKDITIIDENLQPREHRYVGIRNNRIDCVTDTLPEADYGEIYDGRGKLLLPAFCNTHSHLYMALMRGYGENLPLMTWLQDRIFPFEAHLRPEDFYNGTLLGVAEMLRYGIGCTSDMNLLVDPTAQALLDSGVRAVVSRCVTCPSDISFRELPLYKETLEAQKKFNGSGRVRVEFSLHAEYTNSETVTRSIAEAAKEAGSSMHVHVSETRGEVDECRERHQGRSPVRYLADCGLFDVPTVAAHCVHIDAEDIAILKEHGVTVATNPKSNLKLASGICPTAELLEAGVNVALATDSVASNNNLNMLEEMRFFNLLQKGSRGDPTLITPAETLYAATRAGALAQGRPDGGLIKEGYTADLTVLNLDTVNMFPVYNIMNNLVYSASGSDVVLTMVDGRVLYKDGEYTTIDLERAKAEFEKSRLRILSEL